MNSGGVRNKDMIAKMIEDKDSYSQVDREVSCPDEIDEPPRKKIKYAIEKPVQDILQQGRRNALDVFPEELWEIILNELEDGTDVQSVLAAFPELDNCFHGKKTTWLLNEVVPFIFNLIIYRPRDVLNCRTVSKRWCSAVDNFLEEHPSNRPYNRLSVPDRQLSYNFLEDTYSVTLNTTEDVSSFHKNCRGSIRNPFIGRTLKFKKSDEEEDADEFVDAILPLLQEFGHQILYIYMDFGRFLHEDKETCKKSFLKISQCLSYIPNVRRISPHFEFEDTFCFEIDNFLSEYPDLPNLETIVIHEIEEDPDEIHYLERSIAKRYCTSGKIRKVVVPIGFYEYKDMRFMFSSVQDLTVTFDEFNVECNLANLLSLCTTNLKKLKIINHTTPQIMDIFELFKILESAKIELEELEMYCFIGPSNNETGSIFEDDTKDCLKSIRFLRIMNVAGLTFDFLKALPSLQSLHLQRPSYPRMNLEKWRKAIFGEETSFGALVLSYIFHPNVPANLDIWSELPSLNILSVGGNELDFRYVRERRNKPVYNYLKLDSIDFCEDFFYSKGKYVQ